MRTCSSNRVLSLALAALGLLFLTTGLRPAAAGGPSIPIGGPVAGPIEVSTQAEALSTPLGSLLETTLVIENHGIEPARVQLLGRVSWPDGSTQILRYGQPVVIAPDGAFILSALSPVPAGVGAGAGTFTAIAFVGAIGQGGRGTYTGRLIAQSSSPFTLQ